MFETIRDRKLFHLEEQTIDITKVLCAKQFLKKNTKPLPFALRLITLRSSCVNLICSIAIESLDFVSASITLVITKWASLQE